ncbi:MAG: DUF5130 family protein [Marmoricola sp.]
MPAGDAFSSAQQAEIDRAIRGAETTSRFEFSVYVGPSDGESRPFAQRLHASLSSPDRSVLILVDPAARLLEIVTGHDVRRTLGNDVVGLAAVEMQTCFAAGDLLGGIVNGLAQLAESARTPITLHG